MQLTIKLRLKDRHCAELNRQARAVNIIWNYCNEAQKHLLRWDKFLTYYELADLTKGSSKQLCIYSQTIQNVCKEYVRRRKQFKKPYLKFRGKKKLGWIPFNQQAISFDGETFKFVGKYYQPMHCRGLLTSETKILSGSFSQDSKGHWYINCPIEVETAVLTNNLKVGIDLGLNDLATLSTGYKIRAPKFYRKIQLRLGSAQRARKKKQVTNLHTKVKNQRKDFLHKETTKIVKEHGLIFVGNVSPSKLARTKFAKSIYDVSWSGFRGMLHYKSLRNGGASIEINEAYTSQTCSHCGIIPYGRPKGIAGLGIRVFSCSCGISLDRDVNAARNILRIGTDTLAGGTHV
jgi:IS605 OrfB family transposase